VKQFSDHVERVGDRTPLFAAIADRFPISLVLYPGCSLDISASFVFPSVTYVDTNRRAAKFFADRVEVGKLIDRRKRYSGEFDFAFHQLDFINEALPETDGSFELLISLSAGFVSSSCKRYLADGGWLLANDADGDANMAMLDPDFSLVAVILLTDGRFRVETKGVERYFVQKRSTEVTSESLRARGSGHAHTKKAFAYIFRLTR
jgi:hypothetical protein